MANPTKELDDVQMLVLDQNYNKPLRRLINREYIKTPTAGVVYAIQNCMPGYPVNALELVDRNLRDTVNSIVIDNIILSMKRDQVSLMLRAISNQQLSGLFECGIPHFNNLFDHNTNIPVYDNSEFSVMSTINNYVETIYRNNVEEFTEAAMELMSMLVNYSYLADRVIRSGFIDRERPVLYVKKAYEDR